MCIHTSHIYPCISVFGLCCKEFVRLDYCHDCSQVKMCWVCWRLFMHFPEIVNTNGKSRRAASSLDLLRFFVSDFFYLGPGHAQDWNPSSSMSFPRDKEELATVAVSSSVLLDQGRVKVEPFCKTWHVQDHARWNALFIFSALQPGTSRCIKVHPLCLLGLLSHHSFEVSKISHRIMIQREARLQSTLYWNHANSQCVCSGHCSDPRKSWDTRPPPFAFCTLLHPTEWFNCSEAHETQGVTHMLRQIVSTKGFGILAVGFKARGSEAGGALNLVDLTWPGPDPDRSEAHPFGWFGCLLLLGFCLFLTLFICNSVSLLLFLAAIFHGMIWRTSSWTNTPSH